MGAAIMRTEESVSDGMWHNAVLERKGDIGTLYVDGYLKANGTSKGDSAFIDLQVNIVCQQGRWWFLSVYICKCKKVGCIITI